MSFSDRSLYGVCHRRHRRCLCCHKLFTYSSSSQELKPISTKFGTKHPYPWVKRIQVLSNNRTAMLFSKGRQLRNSENILMKLKIFFSIKNHWANVNQTWHKASLGEEYYSLFKGHAQPSRDNYEIAKIYTDEI